MKLTQLPAIVACRDGNEIRADGRTNPCHHRPGHRRLVNAVDDDLEAAGCPVHEAGLHASHQRRAECLVRRGAEGLVTRADLAARSHDASRKGRDRASSGGDGVHSPPGGGKRGGQRSALQDEISAADTLLDAHRLFHEKLPVHYRHPPVSASIHHLCLFKPVAEVPHVSPQRPPLLRCGQAIEDAGRGACQQALRGAIGNRLSHAVRSKTVGQNRRSGPAVGRFLRLKPAFHADLCVTADHARTVAARGADRRVEPVRIGRGDNEPDVPEPKGLGKRVDDLC